MSFSQCPSAVDVDHFAGWGAGPLSLAGTDQWQSFTNVTTGKLTKINLLLNDGPFDFTLSIYEGVGVGGQLLYSEGYTLVAGTWTDVHLPLASAPNLTSGLEYTFSIESGASFNSYVQIGDTYSGGVCSSIINGLQTDWDMNFTTYIAPDPPQFDAGTNQTTCEGTEVTLFGTGADTYVWDNGVINNTAFIPNVGINVFNVVGTFTNGCQNIDSIFITVNPNPIIVVSDDQFFCLGDNITLQVSGADSFIWEDLSTDDSYTISPSTTTNITVKGTTLDCSSTKTILLTLDSVSCSINFGNTISCNNDGVNDTWEIQGIESFPDNKVTIYNRWGDVIFEVENYDNTLVVWDGKLPNTLDAKPGTYFYNVTIKNGQTQNGWIELLR